MAIKQRDVKKCNIQILVDKIRVEGFIYSKYVACYLSSYELSKSYLMCTLSDSDYKMRELLK